MAKIIFIFYTHSAYSHERKLPSFQRASNRKQKPFRIPRKKINQQKYQDAIAEKQHDRIPFVESVISLFSTFVSILIGWIYMGHKIHSNFMDMILCLSWVPWASDWMLLAFSLSLACFVTTLHGDQFSMHADVMYFTHYICKHYYFRTAKNGYLSTHNQNDVANGVRCGLHFTHTNTLFIS